MMLGDFLYRLTDKDAISQPVLQRGLLSGGGNVAAVNVDVLLGPIPADRVFQCTNLSAIGIGGGAQTLGRLDWVIFDGLNALVNAANWSPNPPINTWGNSAACDFYLWPGEYLRCRGVFSAGAIANVVSAGAIGMYLPKGTLQLR